MVRFFDYKDFWLRVEGGLRFGWNIYSKLKILSRRLAFLVSSLSFFSDVDWWHIYDFSKVTLYFFFFFKKNSSSVLFRPLGFFLCLVELVNTWASVAHGYVILGFSLFRSMNYYFWFKKKKIPRNFDCSCKSMGKNIRIILPALSFFPFESDYLYMEEKHKFLRTKAFNSSTSFACNITVKI